MLAALPLSSSEFGLAGNRLNNARRYFQSAERGAARYELRLLERTLQSLADSQQNSCIAPRPRGGFRAIAGRGSLRQRAASRAVQARRSGPIGAGTPSAGRFPPRLNSPPVLCYTDAMTLIQDHAVASGDSVSDWLVRLKAGDQEMAQRLWRRYLQRLIRVANRRLARRPSASPTKKMWSSPPFTPF